MKRWISSRNLKEKSMKWISDRRNTISRSKNATGGIGSETLGPSSNFVDGITKSDKQDINIADMVPSSITSSSIDNNSDIQNSASRSSLPSSIASTTSKQSTTPSITTNDSASFHTTDSGSNNTIRFHQELEVIQQEMIGMEQIKSMILDQNDLDLDIGAENMWKSISCETIAVDNGIRDEKSLSHKSSLDSEVDLIEFESPFVVYSRQLDVLGRLEQDPLDSRSITVEETKEEADSLELKFDLKHEHSYFENSELLTSKIIVKYGADYVISLLARAWKESFLKQYEINLALICIAVASTYTSTVACEGKLSAAIVQFISLCHELGILTYNHQQLCTCILCGKEMNMYDALDYHGCSSLFEDSFEVHLLNPLQQFCVYMIESGEISYNRELVACRNCRSYESPLQFIVHCCRKSDAVLETVNEDVKAHPNRNEKVFASKEVHETNFGLVEGHFAENNESLDAEFRAAVLGNDIMKIRSILDNEQLYNPPTDSIITAASLGHYESVVELLTCTRIRSPIYEFKAFLKAIENSDTNPYCFRIMSMMMQDDQFDPSLYKNDALILASKLGRVQCLNEMLMDDRIDCGDQEQKALISASEGGHYDVVQTLLEQDKVDATARDNEAFILACEMGHFKIVELLLNDDPRLDASCRENEGLILACRNGHTETVRVLLQQDSVDPSARNDEPLIQAIKIGNDEIVFMLLDSTRKPRHRIMRKPLPSIISKPKTVDPSCRSNWPILIASKLGHFSIVSRLLEDKRTDPSVENNEALLTAIAGNHLKVVQLLLRAPKVDPADQNNKSIIVACYYGHSEIVKLLLQDPRVDPKANNNDCFILAIKNGHLKTVELLLNDSRFQVRPRIDEARSLAENHGHKEISDLLRPKEITN